MQIEIRDATPADAPFVAWVQQEATRSGRSLGFWDVALPGPDPQRLAVVEDVATAPKQGFSHISGFLVAELSGEPIAAASAYDPSDKPLGRFVFALNEALSRRGWNEAHLELMAKRITPVVTCLSDAADGIWVIEWVACKPEARGKGIAQRLLTALLERGRQRGYGQAQISYLLGNTPAERCYQRAGFRTVDDKRSPDFEHIFGAPGTARMLREL